MGVLPGQIAARSSFDPSIEALVVAKMSLSWRSRVSRLRPGPTNLIKPSNSVVYLRVKLSVNSVIVGVKRVE